MLRFTRVAVLILAAAAVSAGAAQASFWPSKDAWLGREYLLRQQWAAAAQAYARATKRGHPSPDELEGLGYAALKAGLFDQAAQTYEKLCARYPKNASFRVNLGLAYAYQDRADLMDRAEQAFRQAVELHPRDPDALL